jgi:MoaA/NifB/PqqE/SkfB family radical SAM enzyme
MDRSSDRNTLHGHASMKCRKSARKGSVTTRRGDNVEIPAGGSSVTPPDRPSLVIWDVTYACPLRCVHCYSESGRRPAAELSHADKLRIADAIIAVRPAGVCFAGGEPLLVDGLFELAARFARAGIPVGMFTGGWRFAPPMVAAAVEVFDQISVSVDGATAEVHDRIRGRAGSFDRAIQTLRRLIAATGAIRAAGGKGPRIGLDCVVVRGNAHQVDDVCTRLAATLPGLDTLAFGAVVPTGLASRTGFVEAEVLTDEQAELLGSADEARRLQALAPAGVTVTATDNRFLQMRPDLVARGIVLPAMQIEPDGGVRAMPIYEGTVGNLRSEAADVLWRRAVARWTDPFVTAQLDGALSMARWAEAARRIDYHFGSAAVRARIDRRPRYAASGA